MRLIAKTVVTVCAYAGLSVHVKGQLHSGEIRLGDLNFRDEVPDFSLHDLDGEMVSLDAIVAEHELVLVNFWATWCGPCRMEKPTLNRLQEKHRDDGFLILAVNVGEPEHVIREYLEEAGLSLRVLMDTDGEVADMLGVRGLPTSILVDKDRRLDHVSVGLDPSLQWMIEWKLESN